MANVEVDLPGRSYSIRIGRGLIQAGEDGMGDYLSNGSRVMVIADRNTSTSCYPLLERRLQQFGVSPVIFILEGSERDKAIDTLSRCYEAMARSVFDRDSFVLALGGGVIGDLAGFVAATYMRGIRLIQVPTTLLAMVDSSIGGKNGINFPWGKNVVGTFYQPSLVLSDLVFLDSLPEESYRDGMAEVIKYGVLEGGDLLSRLRDAQVEIRNRDPLILTEIVTRCSEVKAGIVEADELEHGLRARLNFGHTIGHALEAAGSFARYSHGQALAIGMRGAFLLSLRLGLIGRDELEQIERLLEVYGLPTAWDLKGVGPADLWNYMERDKKARGGRLVFILTKGFGTVIIRNVQKEKGLILKVLDELRG